MRTHDGSGAHRARRTGADHAAPLPPEAARQFPACGPSTSSPRSTPSLRITGEKGKGYGRLGSADAIDIYSSGTGPLPPFELLRGTPGIEMIKWVGQSPQQCPPGRWDPTRPDEPITDVPSLARRVPRGGRIFLRSQTCRKADAWEIHASQFVPHCGVPEI